MMKITASRMQTVKARLSAQAAARRSSVFVAGGQNGEVRGVLYG
jgi:hypothetical protein